MSFLKKLKTDLEEEEREVEKTPPKKNKSSKKNKKKTTTGQLAVDVYQTSSFICIQAPVAGTDPKDIDINVENEMLTIKGERKEPNGSENRKYLKEECYWGPFIRQIALPEETDASRVKASFENGVLTVKLPRIKKVKKKKIDISVKE